VRRLGWKVLLASATFFYGCQQQRVEGVTINGTLTAQQDYLTNWRMCRLISSALHHDNQALAELIAFDCGGAAGCYDLADVITQIMIRVGEPEFMRMTAHFSPHQQRDVRNFLEVGLEYGSYTVRKSAGNSVHEQLPDLDRQLAH
jgi:hypothetical protein